MRSKAAAGGPTKAELGAVPGWPEDVVRDDGLLGLRVGATLAEVRAALGAVEDTFPSGGDVVLSSCALGHDLTATFRDGALHELAVFHAHGAEEKAAHDADAKATKAFLSARHGKPAGRPKFPEWTVAGTPRYRLWTTSWKERGDDEVEGRYVSKIVMDAGVL